MSVLVTVGTTSFDALIRVIDSVEFIEALTSRGFTSLRIQLGRGTYLPCRINALLEESDEKLQGEGNDGFSCSYFRFKPNLDQDMAKSDLIISHAGAGSIMESLRLKKKLVVVVNEDLMDNHQLELASAMSDQGVLACTFCKNLVEVVRENHFQFSPYPPVDYNIFPSLVDKEMYDVSK